MKKEKQESEQKPRGLLFVLDKDYVPPQPTPHDELMAKIAELAKAGMSGGATDTVH